MKVLQINAVNKLSSTGRTCYEMSEYLNAHGIECVVAHSKGPVTEHSYRIGSINDTKIHGLMSRLSGKQGYYSLSATKALLKYMDKFEPDIVVLRNLHGNYINFPMLMNYLNKKDIAVVTVLHDCWFFTGKCCHYTVAGCDKWQTECGKCPQLKKYNKTWFFDRTRTMFKDKKDLFSSLNTLAVVGVSKWLQNEAKNAPVFACAREIISIYNWVDLSLFNAVDASALRDRLNLNDKKVLLSVAASWSLDKGFDSIKSISEKLSDNQRLVLIGKVPDGTKFNDKVINIAPTNNVEELIEYYSMADVFIQPSLEETFGKVSAEAISCGTPVVCFDSTANPELVANGCGLVSKVGDIDGMMDNINEILTNGKDAYSNICREFAMQNFDMNKNIEKYIELFNRLV